MGNSQDSNEPVAWMTVRLNVPIQTTARKDVADEWLKWGEVQPLYAHQPQRLPLTEDEIFAIENDIPDDVISDRAWTIWFARAVEAAHGIK